MPDGDEHEESSCYGRAVTDTDRLDHRLNRLGSSLFFDPVTVRHGAAHGIDDAFALYVGGRAGAMGDVTFETVVATFGFLHPDLLGPAWDALAVPPSRATTVFAEAMASAARAAWEPGAAATAAALGREVADAVTAPGLPLFTAWRALPVPSDPCGAAAVTVMTLRELRGDVNIQSVAGAGLQPLEAEMATRGADFAAFHGWPEPYPDPEPHRAALAEADAVTSRRMAAAHAVLGDRLPALDAAVAVLAGA